MSFTPVATLRYPQVEATDAARRVVAPYGAGLDYGRRAGITLYAFVLCRTDFGVGVRGRLNCSAAPAPFFLGGFQKGAPFFFGKKNGSPFVCARCEITPHQSAARTAVSLRLGHGAALTCHRHVIHSRGDTALPSRGSQGRGAPSRHAPRCSHENGQIAAPYGAG